MSRNNARLRAIAAMPGRSYERGAALVLALLAGLLLSAIGTSLVVLTSADVLIADNAGASTEAFDAAEGALERVLAELQAAPDLTSVLSGAVASRFVDGAPEGVRMLPGGLRVDLAEVVNEANCHNPARCTETSITAKSRDRPWGARNPRWRPLAYGPLDGAGTNGIPILYLVVLVADDPADDDGDPWLDGGVAAAAPAGGLNPGAGVLLVRAEAFGRRSARRVVEAVIRRPDVALRALWGTQDPATRGDPPTLSPTLMLVGWREAL